MASSSPLLQTKYSNVAIVGGTHGNELHGVHMVQEFNRDPTILAPFYDSMHIQCIHANAAAIAATGTGAGRRYVDIDLNRCFLMKDLADTSRMELEMIRAREINALLGPKGAERPKVDFIVDLHSTTSNTGVLVCCHPKDRFALQLTAYLQATFEGISLAMWADADVPLLPSVSRSGITLEVGPISHSTCVASLYQHTRRVVLAILEYIQLYNNSLNSNNSNTVALSLKRFRRFATVGYPRSLRTRDIVGMIHPSLQGLKEMTTDAFVTLAGNNPLFQTLSGAEFIGIRDVAIPNQSSLSLWDTCNCSFDVADSDLEAFRRYRNSEEYPDSSTLGIGNIKFFPLFVNEAAYFEKDIAMILTVEENIVVDGVCIV